MDGIHMMKRLTGGLVLAFCFGVQLAQADLISFDDVALSDEGIIDKEYPDFSWDSRWALGNTDMRGFSGAASTGSQFLFNNGFANNLEIVRTNPFDFLGAHFTSNGLRDSRTFWISLFAFDGIGNEIGELVDVEINADYKSQRTWIGTDFTNVSRLVVVTGGGLFAMDSLKFQNSAVTVNEAGGFVLLLIGLGGLWAARRRVH